MNPPESSKERTLNEVMEFLNNVFEDQSKWKVVITGEPIKNSGNMRVTVESSATTFRHLVFPMQ